MSTTCERIAELSLAEADGASPSSTEAALRAAHLAECGACRREARALELLRLHEDGPAHFPIDDLARQRLVNASLRKLHEPEEAPEAQPEPVPLARPAWARRAAWATGVLAAAAALALVVRSPTKSSPTLPAEPPAARVLLASGAGAPTAGLRLSEGQRFESGAGPASLALGDKVTVLVESGARLVLTRLKPEGIEAHLESGRLVASIVPNAGARFAVTSAGGRVEVTGTVFSLDARPGWTRLEVLRGSVRVTAQGRAPTKVATLEARELETGETRTMSGAEQSAALAALRRLALLEAGQGCDLEIRSRPAGAVVTVDGEAIGTTPFAAQIKTGHRHLEVLAGSAKAEEWLDLHAGATTIRDYDLSPTPAAEPVAVVRPRLRAEPKAAQPRVAAQELLRRAQELRARQEWAGAAAAYRELIAKYPASPASETARVSLGEVLAEHLDDPRGALQACAEYLARHPDGPVASEAQACRARALRGLGR